MSGLALEVRGLHFAYQQAPVLAGVDFQLEQGSLVSLLGPNGAGKSTMFKCVLGLLEGWKGEILLNGRDIRKLSPMKMARTVAYIPQAHSPAFNYSVLDMVLMGTSARVGALSGPGKREVASAMDALELTGIADFSKRDYLRLSGGEQQLVLIARALAQDARVLIMDEPTSSLDFGNQVRVMRLVRALADKGYTILQATHNPNQACQFSDRILAMKDGLILAQGEPREVFNAALVSSLYGVHARVESLCGGQLHVCIPQPQHEEEMTPYEKSFVPGAFPVVAVEFAAPQYPRC